MTSEKVLDLDIRRKNSRGVTEPNVEAQLAQPAVLFRGTMPAMRRLHADLILSIRAIPTAIREILQSIPCYIGRAWGGDVDAAKRLAMLISWVPNDSQRL